MRLSAIESTTTLFAQAVLGFFCLQLVPIQINDLYPHHASHHASSDAHDSKRGRGKQVAVRPTRIIFELWRVPLVKRATSFAFDIGFSVLAAVVFFQRLCGPVNSSHHLLAVWLFAGIVGEVQ